jgi:Ulp1 family protease
VNSKTRILIVFTIENEKDIKETARNLYNFFNNSDPRERVFPIPFEFLKLSKSQELIYTICREENKSKEIIKFMRLSKIRDLIKYPSPQQSDAFIITTNDMQCLKPGEFLNDNIISFYLRYLQLEVLTEKQRKKTHIFDTFFYQRLSTQNLPVRNDTRLKAAQVRHEKVKNWTRSTIHI